MLWGHGTLFVITFTLGEPLLADFTAAVGGWHENVRARYPSRLLRLFSDPAYNSLGRGLCYIEAAPGIGHVENATK